MVPSTSEADFTRRALRYWFSEYLKLLRRLPRRGLARAFHWRSPQVVGADYDRQRGALLERLPDLKWEDVVFGTEFYLQGDEEKDFVLLNDRVVWSSYRGPRAFMLTQLEDAVNAAVEDGDTVVEFGSGTGRNLLQLKRRFPEVNFIGLELSPVSVELAQRLAAKFGVDVSFRVCNAAEPLPAHLPPGSARLAFTCHMLEMMPRIFPQALRNLCEVSTEHVKLFEPVPELWPLNGRGVASRLRVLVLDRLRGLMPAVRQFTRASRWSLVSARRLQTASTALNETCLIHLRRDL